MIKSKHYAVLGYEQKVLTSSPIPTTAVTYFKIVLVDGIKEVIILEKFSSFEAGRK